MEFTIDEIKKVNKLISEGRRKFDHTPTFLSTRKNLYLVNN